MTNLLLNGHEMILRVEITEHVNNYFSLFVNSSSRRWVSDSESESETSYTIVYEKK